MNKIELGTLPVPYEMLLDAEMDKNLQGVVLSRKGQQVSIVANNTVVGFLTPRKDGDYWRTGAIYIVPKYRNNRYGAAAVVSFFSDKQKGLSLIEPDNYPSQRAFASAGFKHTRDITHDGTVFQIWKKG